MSAARRAAGRAGERAQRVAGGDINEALRVRSSTDGERVRQDRARTPRLASTRRRPRACAGSPSRARRRARRAVLDGRRRALPRARVDRARAALERDRARQLGRGLRASCTRPARRASARGGGAVRSARLASPAPTTPTADWPAFYAERRLGPLLAWPPTAARCPPRGARSSASCDAHRRARRAAPSRPRACTATCGAATCCAGADGRAVADRSRGLRRPPRGRPRDAAPVRRPGPRIFAAYEEAAPLADGTQERVELYQLLPLLVHARCSAAATSPRPNALPRATPDASRRAGVLRPGVLRPGARAPSEWGGCAPTRSPPAAGFTSSRE